MNLEELNYALKTVHNKAHRLAFRHYICWGKVPEEITKIVEDTSSMEKFLEYLDHSKKHNPYHKPAGTPEGGQFDFAPGGLGRTSNGAGSVRKPRDDTARDIFRRFPDENYAEPALGHAHEVDAAIAAGLMLGLRGAPALIEAGIAGATARITRTRITNILMPRGKPIGRAGTSEPIRELSDKYMFEKTLRDLTKEGKISTPPELAEKGGVRYTMPDGSHIIYRAKSNSGPPTIDVNVPSLRGAIKKIKLVDGGK